MKQFVSLVHTVFNAGTEVSWADNDAELRHFRSVDEWISYLGNLGLQHHGDRLLQANDPTDNLLLMFTR